MSPGTPADGSQHEPEAEIAYGEFLRRRSTGEDLDFDAYVEARPEIADALRILRSLDEGALSATASIGGADPVRRLLGGGASAELADRVPSGLSGAKRYGEREEIARGGMGVVFRVWDEDIDRPLAMKVMLAAPGERQSLGRFLDEAKVTGQLEHPGIVSVHELGLDDDGRPYFTMQLVRGRELKHVFDLVRRGGEGWTCTRVLNVLVKVCEAIAYAHSRGVIHRDLKPQNVMVGRFGETYVMDWGLAKSIGEHDTDRGALHSRSASRADDELHSPLRTADGTVLGTPAYMPPEQAQGCVDELDARTDVYAIGAMLYELLAGCAPYLSEGRSRSPTEVLSAVLDGPPPELRQLVSDLAPELQAICEKAMARESSARYPSAAELGRDLQAYLDNRVVLAYRTGAIAEFRKWIGRNTGMAVSIASGVVLAFLLVVGWAISVHIERQEILRLSDVKRLEEFAVEAEALWPAYPRRIAEMVSWLGRAKRLSGRLDLHRDTLDAMRRDPDARLDHEASGEPVWKFAEAETQWQHDTVAGLVQGLELFEATIADVESRLEFARTVHEKTIDDCRELWDDAMASIADPNECPMYDGLEIVEQLGLVPIGRDPGSGLWEFVVLQTGRVPERRADGKLAVTEETGLILVLLPGGTFRMGAVEPTAEQPLGLPNVDPQAADDEGPVHSVALDPFFISKFEMTQGQWLRFTGTNPSTYDPSRNVHGRQHDLLHPVEHFNLDDARRVTAHLGLAIPTEAQWEYAARGGMTTVWWTGNSKESLAGALNIADSAARRSGASWPALSDWPELDDGYVAHAPVGTYRANPFGLHDVYGNVWEWCREGYSAVAYTLPARSGDGERQVTDASLWVARGGSFGTTARNVRSAARDKRNPGLLVGLVGIRPVRRLDVVRE